LFANFVYVNINKRFKELYRCQVRAINPHRNFTLLLSSFIVRTDTHLNNF